MRTTTARQGPVAEGVAAWFAHQRTLAEDGHRGPLALAPGIGLVRESVRAGDGGVVDVFHAVAAPPAILERVALAPALFALLERVTTEEIRLADLDDPRLLREVGDLLDRGYLHFRG